MSNETIILQRDLNSAREELASLRQELRTPLNTVLGFAQLLKTSPLGDCELVEEIFSAATRLADILQETSLAETPKLNEGGLSKAEAIPTNGKRAVLCIEDNPANSRLIERILAQRPKLTLCFAAGGAEGLAKARDHKPDLVLLDLNLPDMHGSEVLRSLRQDKRTASVPVVVISADATSTQIERLLSDGARNYLTKPINVARFLHTVDEILDSPLAAAQDRSQREVDEAVIARTLRIA